MKPSSTTELAGGGSYDNAYHWARIRCAGLSFPNDAASAHIGFRLCRAVTGLTYIAERLRWERP